MTTDDLIVSVSLKDEQLRRLVGGCMVIKTKPVPANRHRTGTNCAQADSEQGVTLIYDPVPDQYFNGWVSE